MIIIITIISSLLSLLLLYRYYSLYNIIIIIIIIIIGESISVILVSEIGDKTFFIAAILAMRNNKITVFLGTISKKLILIFEIDR